MNPQRRCDLVYGTLLIEHLADGMVEYKGNCVILRRTQLWIVDCGWRTEFLKVSSLLELVLEVI